MAAATGASAKARIRLLKDRFTFPPENVLDLVYAPRPKRHHRAGTLVHPQVKHNEFEEEFVILR